MYGLKEQSSYNHNIYYSSELNETILKKCNDDFYSYWKLIDGEFVIWEIFFFVNGIFDLRDIRNIINVYMVFSLFEESIPDPRHKVQLKNCSRVTIGSGSDIECAFQVGNFMNMLFHRIIERNFENCFVSLNNLSFDLDRLVNFCSIKSNDSSDNSKYEFYRKEFQSRIESLKDELSFLKTLGRSGINVSSIPVLGLKIELSVKSVCGKYVQLVNLIVHVFPEYYESLEK